MTLVGAVIFAGSLAGAFGKFLSGALSDRLGRKRVMTLALLGSAIATAAFGTLALHPRPAWAAVAALFVAGTWCRFMFDPACQAMVADISDPSSRIYGYSLLRVGANLGWAVGAILGGLIGAVGFAAMFLTTSVLTLLAMVLLLIAVGESRVRSDEPRGGWVWEALQAPGFLALCAAGLLIHIVMTQLVAPLSVFGTKHLHLTPPEAGLMFTLNGLVIVFFQYPMARLISRMRLTTALVCGSLVYAVGYGAVGLAGGFWGVALCVLVISCGELLVAPSALSLAANIAPAAQRGGYLGVFGFFEMFGRCMGPLLGGLALDLFSERPWMHWGLIGCVGLAAAMGFVGVRLRLAAGVDRG